MLGVSGGVVGFNVAVFLRAVRDICRPAAVFRRVGAKKFAQCTQNTPNSAFLGVLGEYCRGNATGGAALGEFLRAVGLAAGRRRPYSTRWVNVRINGFG